MSIAIVAHDSGGAEIISSYVQREKLNCQYTLAGPAGKIFENKLGVTSTVSLEKSLSQCDWMLCGSGWQSDLEWLAIRKAKQLRKKSVVFLDHWVNYQQRFIRNGIIALPDEIWVGDEAAYEIAKKTFPDICINVVQNPYFIDLKVELEKISKDIKKNTTTGHHILYVCEPVEAHDLIDKRVRDYNEHDALRYFLTNIQRTYLNPVSIIVRPHPAEVESKYQWIFNEFDLPLSLTREKSLISMVAESDIVAGCESMAMVVGLIARKEVICSIPAKKGTCVLPFPEIKYLHELLI